MSDDQVEAGNENARSHGGRWLMGRAIDERWSIPEGLRGPLIQRLADIVGDPSATTRDVLAAASALMTASKINLANIETTMRVQNHEEIEQRLTEVEEYIASTRGEQLN
jgi:hypothetical protein